MTDNFSSDVVKQYLQSIGKWEEFSNLINSKKNVTIVTGLWDLGRAELTGWARRDFETYKQNFFKFLKTDIPMCIWIPSSLEEDVWKIRSKENTRVYIKEVEEFKTWFPFFEQHEAIRTNPEWYNIAGWLKESPQAALPMYNPMMMSKVFMVNDSAIYNPFNSDYFYWMDGGINNTVSQNYFDDGSIFSNVATVYENTLVHIGYPYQADKEIHGFEKNKFYEYCRLPLDDQPILISRGGFWGGPKELIHQYNVLYYSVLSDTISSGFSGADECLFTMLAYIYPHLIERYVVEGNGLIWPFFEEMKNINEALQFKNKKINSNITNLYVLGFNSPKQFETLCKSLKDADEDFIKKPRKILINNSTDESTFEEYDKLCNEYGFEEIHRENLGVCGGRQFAADHFNESGARYYMFFEDDMFLNDKEVTGVCKTGFNRYIPNLYNVIHNIMNKSKLDFLKLSFSEFYGENSTQWAWYNVPQEIRTKVWPDYDQLPVSGIDPNCPKTKFEHIYVTDGVPYITGEIYYSNWPQIVNREGNQKMFLETRWTRPYEQTWMSHMFQLSREKKLNGSILLASPVTHNRFEFYKDDLRKES